MKMAQVGQNFNQWILNSTMKQVGRDIRESRYGLLISLFPGHQNLERAFHHGLLEWIMNCTAINDFRKTQTRGNIKTKRTPTQVPGQNICPDEVELDWLIISLHSFSQKNSRSPKAGSSSSNHTAVGLSFAKNIRFIHAGFRAEKNFKANTASPLIVGVPAIPNFPPRVVIEGPRAVRATPPIWLYAVLKISYALSNGTEK